MEKKNKAEELLKKDGEEAIPKGSISQFINDKEKEISEIILELSQDTEIYNPKQTFNRLKKYQSSLQKKNKGRPLYSKITKKIHDMDENKKNNITENLTKLISFTEKEKEDSIFPIIFKIYDHINLAQFQELEIKQAVEDAKANISAMFENSEKKFDEKAEKEKIKAIKEITKNINDESRGAQRGYVTILGIFAAIILAAFSSLSLAKNATEGNYGDLHGAILLNTILGTLVLGLIQMLLSAIFKMEGKEYHWYNVVLSCIALWIAAAAAWYVAQ